MIFGKFLDKLTALVGREEGEGKGEGEGRGIGEGWEDCEKKLCLFNFFSFQKKTCDFSKAL